MAAGGGLARPEPTGYGHTDSETAYRGDTSVGGLRTHPNESPYEFKNWGEAWDESHKETGRKRKPADDVERLEPRPDWPTRTEASSMNWKEALYGDKMKATDLDKEPGGVLSWQGQPVGVQRENMMVILDRPLAPLVDVVRDLILSSEAEGLRVERLDQEKLVNFIRQIRRIDQQPKAPEGDQPMTGIAKTKRTRKAKADGPSAAHKKIINEILEREDAKPTGDAVRLAESNPRKEFSRYQIPTDRGIKDIEIWGDMIKVRSESTYGFGKKAGDMDGLPDRIAPDGYGAPPETGMPDEVMPDEGMPDDGMPDEMPDEGMPDGMPLRISVSVSSPEGMEEEEIISMLDEVLRDPDVSEMINERLAESGLSLSIVAIDPDDEMDDDEMDDDDMDTDEYDDVADEVVDPGEGDVQEGCGY